MVSASWMLLLLTIRQSTQCCPKRPRTQTAAPRPPPQPLLNALSILMSTNRKAYIKYSCIRKTVYIKHFLCLPRLADRALSFVGGKGTVSVRKQMSGIDTESWFHTSLTMLSCFNNSTLTVQKNSDLLHGILNSKQRSCPWMVGGQRFEWGCGVHAGLLYLCHDRDMSLRTKM